MANLLRGLRVGFARVRTPRGGVRERLENLEHGGVVGRAAEEGCAGYGRVSRLRR